MMEIQSSPGLYRDINSLELSRYGMKINKWQLLIILLCVGYVVFYCVTSKTWKEGYEMSCVDTYRDGANGNYTVATIEGEPSGYIYAHWTGKLFKPLTMVSLHTARMTMFVLLLIAYSILLHRLVKTNYGWIIAFVTLKLFAWIILNGNIAVLLCLACVTPLVWITPIFKLYLFPFIVMYSIRDVFRKWINEVNPDVPN